MDMDFMTVVTLILMAVLIVICIANIVDPHWVWKKFQSRKATKEPEEMYFRSKRLSSIIGLVMITVFVLLPTVAGLLME